MLLGLITDIHEDAWALRRALERFRDARVDQVVMIGDIVLDGENLVETCRLLNESGAIGVWGNHDFRRIQQARETPEEFDPEVVRCLTALKPRLSLAGCHFCHVEPWLDPDDESQLWWYEGMPETAERREKIFAAVPERVIFAGHYHRWLAATPSGFKEWVSGTRIRLDPPGRWFVVVEALCEGSAAIYDTETAWLSPVWLW